MRNEKKISSAHVIVMMILLPELWAATSLGLSKSLPYIKGEFLSLALFLVGFPKETCTCSSGTHDPQPFFQSR